MKMKSAIFCVQNYGAFEGDQHEFITDETHGTLVTKWRAGWACLMLTPAPNGRELNWKRDQIKGKKWKYNGWRRYGASAIFLILDNLESVTAAPLAIPHSLNPTQREELRSFLAALSGGQTLVLLGSRGDEAWLAKDTFADNVYHLEGLDPEAASDLADAVLRRAGAQGRRAESAFKELMALLAGYPLALQVCCHICRSRHRPRCLRSCAKAWPKSTSRPGLLRSWNGRGA